RLAYRGEGRWQLEFPAAAPECAAGSGICKCAIAKASKERTLLIGDGRSDFCVAERADFVFAKGQLIGHCRQSGIAHAVFADFADAQVLLQDIIKRERAVAPVAERVAHG